MIKIGFSHHPKGRLKQLQIGHPEPLELMGTMPGSIQLEAQLHRQFRDLRGAGEWFQAGQELLDYIGASITNTRPRDPKISALIRQLLKSRRNYSQQKRDLVSNLVQQLQNYDRETDPTARANLERFIGWSSAAIQRAV
jgi:superfamily II RNA helicase